MISAILLAAGSSTRMGDIDKLFLKYKNNWLINHVMQQLWASKLNELIVVREIYSENLLGGLSSEKIKIVLNPLADQGMTSSIQAGVQAANNMATGFMICHADMPLITSQEYNQIIEKFEEAYLKNNNCIAVPFFQKQKGNPVIFSNSYSSDILQHTEKNGCRKLILENPQHVVAVEMTTDHVLVDVDTMDDWENLEKR